MSNLFLTLVIAFVIIVFAIALLAIGWLIKGKTRIEKTCGEDSAKQKNGNCPIDEVCSPSPQTSPPLEKDQQPSPPAHS